MKDKTATPSVKELCERNGITVDYLLEYCIGEIFADNTDIVAETLIEEGSLILDCSSLPAPVSYSEVNYDEDGNRYGVYDVKEWLKEADLGELLEDNSENMIFEEA